MSNDATNRATTLRVVGPTLSLPDTATIGHREREQEQERRMWSYADEMNESIRQSRATGLGAIVPIDPEHARSVLAREEAELDAQAKALDTLIGPDALCYPKAAHHGLAGDAELHYPEAPESSASPAQVDSYADQLAWLDSSAGRSFLMQQSLRRTA